MSRLRKLRTPSLVSAALLISLLAAGTAVAGASPAAAQSTPSCTFNGSSLGIVTGVTEGGTVQISCTGLPALHPYLVLETSLVLALDPSTAALLSGTVSPSLLISTLSALPLINPEALKVTYSDENGNLSYSFTTPTDQPLDPNASCPPSTEEFNSGLLGCAIAMVDLTTADELAAGSALLEYQGFPLFPPNPTLKIKPKKETPGEAVTVSDKKNASTYWWVATLADLEGDLSGGSGGNAGTTTVNIGGVGQGIPNTISVSPASYNGTTFTPPAISGGFTIPSSAPAGTHEATVFYAADLGGLPLAIRGKTPITVSG